MTSKTGRERIGGGPPDTLQVDPVAGDCMLHSNEASLELSSMYTSE